MKNTDIQYPKFRWFVMVTMIIGVVAQGVIMIAPAPVIGEVATYLDKELGLVTFTVMGLWTVTVCLGGVIGGAVVDKVGIVKVYLVSGMLLVLSTVLIPFAGTNLILIIFLRLIGGAGVGPIITSISRMAAEWFPLEERGWITGVQGMATAMGVFVGFGVSPMVYKATSSWPVTMVYMAVPAVIFLFFTVLMQFGPKAPEMVLEEIEDPKAASLDFKKAISEPIIYLCIVYVFLFNWLIQGINDLTPGYFGIDKPVGVGFGIQTAGMLMMLFQGTFMLGSLVSGWINEKVYKGNTRLQIMLAFMLAGVYFFVRLPGVFGQGPNIVLICVLFVSAFSMGQGIATIMAFISKNYPEHITGKVGGMALGLGLIGGTVGVGVGSRAITQTGNYQASILIVSVVALIGFVFALGLKKPKAFNHLPFKHLHGE